MFSGLALHRDLRREHYSVSALLLLSLGMFQQSVVLLLKSPRNLLQINVTTTLGTLNVAAEVDGVKIKGDGEMHMTLSSSLLPNLNRQLQFVSYTNTLFHPSTADMGERLIPFLGFKFIYLFFKEMVASYLILPLY